MILVIYAHPYPQHSRAGKAMLEAVRDLPDLEVRSLYDLYPDFDIDIAAEQAALKRAELVLARGWAYGKEGTALHGKRCLWVATTGGDETTYSADGMHEQPFANFIAPVEQTARFCGMRWQAPMVVHGAHTVSDQALQAMAQALRTRLHDLRHAPPPLDLAVQEPQA